MHDLALYIHWPFCRAKCPYCDFNSHVREKIDHQTWKEALLQELGYMAERIGDRRLASIFFGGGTPSLMPVDIVEDLIKAAKNNWAVKDDLEITLEANPNSAEQEKFLGFREAGVNRLSLGVQSFDDRALRFLGRAHDAKEARRAIHWASEIFPRFTFDLIYARPRQSLEDWMRELDLALEYRPRHLSLYQLTIEKGTKFEQAHDRGDFVMPDEEQSLAFFTYTQNRLEEACLPAYEISNHARKGEESRHNLAYWRYEDYLGIGPGAHSRVTIDGQKYALRQHRAPEIWLKRVGGEGHATQEKHALSLKEQRQERILMGLRLREGIDAEDVSDQAVEPLVKMKWLEIAEGKIRLTDEGRPLLNAILDKILNG